MSKIYLASPYGFAESTVHFLGELKARLKSEGFEIIDPWELGKEIMASFKNTSAQLPTDQKLAELAKTNHRLGKTNREAIERSDFVVAALDGADVDSGTASEIGYAYGLGKKIFGYRGDLRLTGENEAASVNLQVQYWIEESGGHIVRTIPELIASLKKDGT